eukprot:832629_1
MASENCKPTAKCLGIATLVIVGLFFVYNVVLKDPIPDFDLEFGDDHLLHVTLTNIDKFREFYREAEEGGLFNIELKEKAQQVQVADKIYILGSEFEQKKSVVFSDRIADYRGGSVTVTYTLGKQGFGSSTKKVPTESKSNNKERGQALLRHRDEYVTGQ